LGKGRIGIARCGTIKKIADGDPWAMPATIDDPAILGEIEGRAEGAWE
jgi:propionyl-CoA synthetase